MGSMLGLGYLAGGAAQGMEEGEMLRMRQMQMQQMKRQQMQEQMAAMALGQVGQGGVPGLPGGAPPGGGMPGMGGPPGGAMPTRSLAGNIMPGGTPPPGAGGPPGAMQGGPPGGALPPGGGGISPPPPMGGGAPAAMMGNRPPAPPAPPQAAPQPPPQFGAPLGNDPFDAIISKALGPKGQAWVQTSGYRPAAQEARLRANGAPAVGPGKTSMHSTGSPGAPGARDIVVKGMPADQAVARLKALGFRQVVAEGPYVTKDGIHHGAHIHIDAEVAKPGQEAPSPPAAPPGGTGGAPSAPAGGASPPPTQDRLMEMYETMQAQTSPEALSKSIGAVSSYFRGKNPKFTDEQVGLMTEAYFKAAAQAAGQQRQMSAADMLLMREAGTDQRLTQRGAQSDEQIDRRGGIQEDLQTQRLAAQQKMLDERLQQSQRQFAQREKDIDARLQKRQGFATQNAAVRAQVAKLKAARQAAVDTITGLKTAGGGVVSQADAAKLKAAQAQLDQADQAMVKLQAGLSNVGPREPTPGGAMPAGVRSVQPVG